MNDESLSIGSLVRLNCWVDQVPAWGKDMIPEPRIGIIVDRYMSEKCRYEYLVYNKGVFKYYELSQLIKF